MAEDLFDSEFWAIVADVQEEMGIGCIDHKLIKETCRSTLEKVQASKASKPIEKRSALDHLLQVGEADIRLKIREAACSKCERSIVSDEDAECMKDLAFKDYGFDEAHWKCFKSLVVGRPVFRPQAMTDAELRAAGVQSWKEYCLRKEMVLLLTSHS